MIEQTRHPEQHPTSNSLVADTARLTDWSRNGLLSLATPLAFRRVDIEMGRRLGQLIHLSYVRGFGNRGDGGRCVWMKDVRRSQRWQGVIDIDVVDRVRDVRGGWRRCMHSRLPGGGREHVRHAASRCDGDADSRCGPDADSRLGGNTTIWCRWRCTWPENVHTMRIGRGGLGSSDDVATVSGTGEKHIRQRPRKRDDRGNKLMANGLGLVGVSVGRCTVRRS